MVEFDKLPPKSRALILATLGLEIASAHCTSIFDLARKRHQSMDELWRDVCRKTAQPQCTMPRHVLDSRYTAAATPSPAATASATAATSVAPPQLPQPAREAAAAPAADDERAPHWQIVWLAGLAAVLVAGTGLLLVATSSTWAPAITPRPIAAVARAG